jgi:hypothetical protein
MGRKFSIDTNDYLKNPTELRHILTVLVPMNTKWCDLGIQLDIKYHELEEIEERYRGGNLRKCMAEIINNWLRNDTQASWKTLCHALKSELVSEPVIAAEIEKKFILDID